MTARWRARPQLDTKLWPLSAWPTWSHGWLGPSCSPQYHCPTPMVGQEEPGITGGCKGQRSHRVSCLPLGTSSFPTPHPPAQLLPHPTPSQASGPHSYHLASSCPCPNRLGLPGGRDSMQWDKQVKISENSPRALGGTLKVLFLCDPEITAGQKLRIL